MQYRKLGKIDFKVSALGFGCMRLPTTDKNPGSGKIDIKEASRMMRYAIDCGVNYIDTAYMYHQGQSERAVGGILKDGYRQKVMLATKVPPWYIRKPEDFEKILNEQLKRLQTDRIDFLLLHALSSDWWKPVILKHDILSRAEKAKKEGKIGHIGFSFHDEYKVFEEIVNGYDNWEFAQIQYNYMDTDYQAGTKGLKLAAEKGLGLIVMEPLLGGKLARQPQAMIDLYKKAGSAHTPAGLALQWLWDQPEVSVVLSGMSTYDQVEENLKWASSSDKRLSESEMALIGGIRESYNARASIPCTGCGYCMPCPNEVDIPYNFKLYNERFMYDDLAAAQNSYRNFFDSQYRADKCAACRACEEKCPQRIPISEMLPKVHEMLG